MEQNKLKDIFYKFIPSEVIDDISIYGNGHINTTYLVKTTQKDTQKKYILQKINTDIFTNPDELMENIVNVTDFLKKSIIKQGGDTQREALTVIPTVEKKNYYKDENGSCYRVYIFIEDAVTYDLVKNPKDFYESAVAFGKFQNLLADFPACSLHETIPNFHNTYDRYIKLKKAIDENICGRKEEVENEIKFVEEHLWLVSKLIKMQNEGKLPLRVTHNDTKLNNIMMDPKTNKGICVIDLDTVMPGLAVNDFGDSIRFGANTAYEDEKDLSKVSCSLELFDLYTKGFIEGLSGSLTETEISMLPTGAMTMTFECGMRFLTDYLQGDTYFKTHREKHNLDRCRCQFALLKDMEMKEKELNKIVEKYSKKKPVLVIMAAGMGSRYGGLKQIDPIDEQGHIIIDFSIYDAIKAGFEKIVFIIKKENEKDFKEAIGKRMEEKIHVEYVYQELNKLPEGFLVPEGRVKPFGTGHAVLCCKDVIDAPFAVINADDYYGRNAFIKIYEFLENAVCSTPYMFTMVGYKLENTLTENGHVARGVCEIDDNHHLVKISERTHIEHYNNGTAYTEDDGKTWNMLEEGSTVSMNMWGFTPEILKELDKQFPAFLEENLKTNPLKCEFFLPTVVSDLIKNNKAVVDVMKTSDRWYGVTYHEDKEVVVKAIKEFKKQGIYPEEF